jgi:hypothetical protein
MKTDTYNGKYNQDYMMINDGPTIDSGLDGDKKRVEEKVENISEQVSDKAGKVLEGAKEGTKALGKEVSGAMSAIASGVSDAVSSTSEKIEEGVKSVKDMYDGSTVAKITDEFSHLVKKYPMQSFLGALAVGTWLGVKASSRPTANK